MSLAYMARLYPDMLVCDMAETYSVLDWRVLPATLAATLAAGLRENARVKMQISGSRATAETLLLATCADALKVLIWQNTRDGSKGVRPPSSILAALTGGEETGGGGFDTPEEFRAWRARMTGGEHNGG